MAKLTSQTKEVLRIIEKHLLGAKTAFETATTLVEIMQSIERMRTMNNMGEEIADYLDE